LLSTQPDNLKPNPSLNITAININKILTWCIAGFFSIAILGSLFHFVYNWTGKSFLIGAFVPVNESVWEHLKMGLWAVITFSIVECRALGKTVNNYFFAKAIGVMILSLSILLIYYSYTEIIGRNILALDIASYVIGVVLCQLVCFNLFQSQRSRVLNLAGAILLIVTCLVFAIFTYYPPHAGLFRDSRNGTYGIGAGTSDHSEK
jgi:hypothetical protein